VENIKVTHGGLLDKKLETTKNDLKEDDQKVEKKLDYPKHFFRVHHDFRSSDDNHLNDSDTKRGVKKLASLFIDLRHFTTDLFDEINFMRNNPKEYARNVGNHLQYVINRDNQILYEKDGYEMPMYHGEDAIRECIRILQNTKPLRSFEYVEDFRIVCPDKINDQSNYEEPLEKLKEKFPMKTIEFNYDLALPKPETILCLQLIDDFNEQFGKRRNNLLNEDFTKLGISVKKSKGKKVCVYLTFS